MGYIVDSVLQRDFKLPMGTIQGRRPHRELAFNLLASRWAVVSNEPVKPTAIPESGFVYGREDAKLKAPMLKLSSPEPRSS